MRVGEAVRLLAMLVAVTPLTAQENPESLLSRYLKPGLVPIATRADPEWPSDREVLLLAAARLPRTFSGDFDMATQRPYARDGYLELPVRVREYSVTRERMYYWYVPYVHPSKGVTYQFAYAYYEDNTTGRPLLQLSQMGRFGDSPRPLYLVRGPEARLLVEQKLGIRVGREPMAVSVFIWNFRNIVGGDRDWFWYLRDDEGFEWEGKRVHSVFVMPFARVSDMAAVTLDELADRRSVSGLALARHRLYTIDGEDIDLYALDAEQRRGGFTPVSPRKGDAVYLPTLRLMPLVLPVSGEASERTAEEGP